MLIVVCQTLKISFVINISCYLKRNRANRKQVLFKANAEMIQNCARKQIEMQPLVLTGFRCYAEVDAENK